MQEMSFTDAQTHAFLSGDYVDRSFRILICECLSHGNDPLALGPCAADEGHCLSAGARLVNLGQYQSGSDCFHRALSKSVNSDCKQRGMDPVQASKWTKAEMRASSRKHFAFFKLAYYTR